MDSRTLSSIIAVLVMVLTAGAAPASYGAERLPIERIDIDSLTTETQKTLGGQDEFNLVWVIPSVFWDASLGQGAVVPESQRRAIMEIMAKYLIVGVVRAEISPFGSFRFSNEQTVYDSLQITYVTGGGKRLPVKVERRVEDDAQLVIDGMKPMLRNAMGNMGDNFHLFICSGTVGPEQTNISPYEKGAVVVTLTRVGQNAGGTGEITFPLDSLHEPRKCTKCSKEAHISWSFCPWCGTKHND